MVALELLARKIYDRQPACQGIFSGKIVRLKVEIRIGEWHSGSIDNPNIPGCRRIKRSDRHEHKCIPGTAIGLAAGDLFAAFDDGGGVRTRGNAYARTFLWRSSIRDGPLDLRSAGM